MSLPSSAPSERYGCPQCLSVFRAGFARCPLDGAALQGLTGDPLIGHVLADRYVIEELLGEGGMGRVYRARHNRMSRRFAVKVLFGDMAADAKARTRFSREAEAVSRLDHPNVLSVVDFGETDEGLLYLVMDYIEGRELHQLLAAEAPLSPQRVLHLLRQLTRGLAHAHERNLVHRDFKTENVVVTKSGDEEIARIVDFGIAAVGEMMEPNQRLTTEGMVLGTPAYMSPEQSTGEEVDERSDLFSLGVMLYEMLCGRLPFDGNAVTIAKAHLASEVPPIAARVPGLKADPRLEAVAHRLMAKDPEDRFQSARALLAHLDSAFGTADQSEGDANDATVQVGSEEMQRAISAEHVPMLSYQMAELARSQQRPRHRDPRWIVVGATVLTTLIVVVGWIALRGGDPPRSAMVQQPEAAAEPAPAVVPPVASQPIPASTAAPSEPASTAAPSEPASTAAPSEPASTAAPSEPASTAAPQPIPAEPAKEPVEEPAEAAREPVEPRREKPRPRREKPRPPRKAPEPAEKQPAEKQPAEKQPAEKQPEPAPTPPEPAPATQPAPAEDVVTTKEFLQRYEQVGRQLDRLASKRGDAAVAPLRRRYMDIPAADALRSEALRRDADRVLRSIAAGVARELAKK